MPLLNETSFQILADDILQPAEEFTICVSNKKMDDGFEYELVGWFLYLTDVELIEQFY